MNIYIVHIVIFCIEYQASTVARYDQEYQFIIKQQNVLRSKRYGVQSFHTAECFGVHFWQIVQYTSWLKQKFDILEIMLTLSC